MKIAITAFEARPRSGTEAGLAWNWANAYRDLGHDVTVITQRSAVLPGDREAWGSEGVDVRGVGGREYTVAPHGTVQMVRNYGRYTAWVRQAGRLLAGSPDVALHHHVSLSSARLAWPVAHPSTRVLLGPLGGGHLPAFRGLPPRHLVSEGLRGASLPLLGVGQRAHIARRGLPGVVLSTNAETTTYLRRCGVQDVTPMLTDGISEGLIALGPRVLNQRRRLLWAGRMVGTKRPDIALRLTEALLRRGEPVELVMAGDGPERTSLERLAGELGITRSVRFPGRLTWEQMLGEYDESDFYVFVSMRDSSCPGVVEAAARGVPTLAVRHQGVGYLVPSKVASGPVRVRSGAQVVEDLVAAYAQATVPDEYLLRSRLAIDFARTTTWTAKATAALALIDQEVGV